MSKTVIRNVSLVNESRVTLSDVSICDGVIESVVDAGQGITDGYTVIDGTGKHLFPGVIDDQVHFREPGLTHKGDLTTESRAAVAGGVTSFMEMPNTVPNALTQDLLQEKYDRAAEVSPANYSFFMGVSNDNLQEVLSTDPKRVCGIKIFMGSSTGNMLVDNPNTLEAVFAESGLLIATHCEYEPIVRANSEKFLKEYRDSLRPEHHPLIRSEEACYRSSSFAAELAAKHNSRLHILHISTGKEVSLFRNDIPRTAKKLTSEACIHHLWFSDQDYATKGNFIKWNPAVKTASDREMIWQGLLDGRIDVVATDHAPHTLEEKQKPYKDAPSGGPLIQHSLLAMLDFYHQGKISLEGIADKMSHAVADIFNIHKRGYIRPGYYADLVLVDLNDPTTVTRESLLYKCRWSPFEGHTFKSTVVSTFVNGNLVYDRGQLNDNTRGMRLTFDR
ncbi:MAG: hypothetical protein RL220_1729 [Bacteroidota bacterium]